MALTTAHARVSTPEHLPYVKALTPCPCARLVQQSFYPLCFGVFDCRCASFIRWREISGAKKRKKKKTKIAGTGERGEGLVRAGARG